MCVKSVTVKSGPARVGRGLAPAVLVAWPGPPIAACTACGSPGAGCRAAR